MKFLAEQTTEETTLASAGALRNYYAVRVDHELLRNLLLYVSLDRVEDEYQDIDRDDSGRRVVLGANYLANRQLYFSLEISQNRRDSSGADSGAEFSQNLLQLSIELNL